MLNIYMDELLNQLQDSGHGCHIGHEYYGSLEYAGKLKKSMCATFDRAVDWSRRFNESMSIRD